MRVFKLTMTSNCDKVKSDEMMEGMIKMARLSKEYFTDSEVLIVGYPLYDEPGMKMIFPAFLKNNIKVFSMNSKADDDAKDGSGNKIYKSFADLPKVPACAYIYLAKADVAPWVEKIAAAGVKRVLFHSKGDVEPADIEACRKAGLETAVACPMMLLGKGFHRFHKFLAGV